MKYQIQVIINGELTFLNELESAELTKIVDDLESKYSNKAFLEAL